MRALLIGLLLLLVLIPSAPSLAGGGGGDGVEGLRAIAPPALRVGVAVHPGGESLGTNPAYDALVAREFDTLTPENVLKWQWIHPCPPAWLSATNPTVRHWVDEISGGPEDPGAIRDCGDDPTEWHWGPMDAVVDWAAAHDHALLMAPLLWHSQNPGWLTHPSIALDRSERLWLMGAHIDRVVARYCARDRGAIALYNVVNEAIADDGTLYEMGPWAPLGERYVPLAFAMTRRALDRHCPSREIALLYNDFGFEFDAPRFDDAGRPENKSGGVYRLVETLARAGLVDTVGMQTHLRLYQRAGEDGPLYSAEPDWSAMTAVMDRFTRDLGVTVEITELDVSLRRLRRDCAEGAPRPLFGGGDCPIESPPPATLFGAQADWFEGVARACRAASACTGIHLWGIADEESWLAGFSPLIYTRCDATYCPKPAYAALATGLAAQ